MTLMFDEACCWWILRSCRAVLAPALVFAVYSDVSPYSLICSMTDICFAGQKDSTMPCLLRANMSAGGQLSPEQRDSYTMRTFGLHDILSLSCFLLYPI